MDFKVLFHNPEELTLEELAELRKKIRNQTLIPKAAALIGGFSAFLLERAILRRAYFTKSYVVLGLLGGYALGAYSV
jgi:hypothetical protein